MKTKAYTTGREKLFDNPSSPFGLNQDRGKTGWREGVRITASSMSRPSASQDLLSPMRMTMRYCLADLFSGRLHRSRASEADYTDGEQAKSSNVL